MLTPRQKVQIEEQAYRAAHRAVLSSGGTGEEAHDAGIAAQLAKRAEIKADPQAAFLAYRSEH